MASPARNGCATSSDRAIAVTSGTISTTTNVSRSRCHAARALAAVYRPVRPFAGTAGQRGHHFNLGQSARCHGAGRHQATHIAAAHFAGVAFNEGACVEVTNQNRSARSSATASASRRSPSAIGTNGSRGRCVGPLMLPIARSRCSRSSRERPVMSMGRSSATGRPRSVIVTVRPSRTCRR